MIIIQRGSTEWNGDFSDNSPLWTPELIEEVNFVLDTEDGTTMCLLFIDSHTIDICMHMYPNIDIRGYLLII